MKRGVFGAVMLLALVAQGGEPKPVPTLQALPLPLGEISFQYEGRELTRYYYGAGLHRPFLYPVIGPAGRPLTRMGHPHDPESHSHHNSVWISHNDVGGTGFWGDRSPGLIVHQRILRLVDGDKECFVESENAWVGKEKTPLLREMRRTSVQILPGNEWLLLLDLDLEAKAELVLGQTPFGPIGVRMAKTIGVHDGGGTIRNSEGGVDEAGCFRKPARWVDYAGPIAPGVMEGITLFDHPANPHHPVPFHVRDDGWMGAALTFPRAITLRPNEPLRLRYALYVHAGQPPAEQIEAQWKAFAATPWRVIADKK